MTLIIHNPILFGQYKYSTTLMFYWLYVLIERPPTSILPKIRKAAMPFLFREESAIYMAHVTNH